MIKDMAYSDILPSPQDDPYLALGHHEVSTDQLNAAINTLRKADEPTIPAQWLLANALIEAATNPENQGAAPVLLDEADSRLRGLQQPKSTTIALGRLQLKAAVLEAFVPLFRQATTGYTADTGAQGTLFDDFSELSTPRHIRANSYPNGGQPWEEWDEVALHMLIARFSLLRGSDPIYTWPSFARHQVRTDTGSNKIRHDWNMGIDNRFLSTRAIKVNLERETEATFADGIHPLAIAGDGMRSIQSVLGELNDEADAASKLRKLNTKKRAAYPKQRNKIIQASTDILTTLGLLTD